jgi:hypothetical protein
VERSAEARDRPAWWRRLRRRDVLGVREDRAVLADDLAARSAEDPFERGVHVQRDSRLRDEGHAVGREVDERLFRLRFAARLRAVDRGREGGGREHRARDHAVERVAHLEHGSHVERVGKEGDDRGGWELLSRVAEHVDRRDHDLRVVTHAVAGDDQRLAKPSGDGLIATKRNSDHDLRGYTEKTHVS